MLRFGKPVLACAALVIFMLADGVTVFAQELFCAQVIPACDADANPLTPFSDVTDPCFPYYARVCLIRKVEELEQALAKAQGRCSAPRRRKIQRLKTS